MTSSKTPPVDRSVPFAGPVTTLATRAHRLRAHGTASVAAAARAAAAPSAGGAAASAATMVTLGVGAAALVARLPFDPASPLGVAGDVVALGAGCGMAAQYAMRLTLDTVDALAVVGPDDLQRPPYTRFGAFLSAVRRRQGHTSRLSLADETPVFPTRPTPPAPTTPDNAPLSVRSDSDQTPSARPAVLEPPKPWKHTP